MNRRHSRFRSVVALLLTFVAARAVADRPYPILFVTQVPIPYDFTAIASVFGNQGTAMQSVGRGGDLYILYPDGTLRNLTALAGFGVASGFQGTTSIAVREPSVHWSGTKAIFSMVVGAPPQQFQWGTWYWQMYEVTGLGPGDTPVITPVPNQPANANNVSPVYGANGRILFTSDRPRDGAAHLYPQLDEYEEAPTVSGIWSLDPATGDLRLLDHAPSGDFRPIVDSFGRVLFTRWDHLQRDQQADSDYFDEQGGNPPTYGTFNWSSERADATALTTRVEQFPEPRPGRDDLLLPYEEGHTFNHFFPWMMRQDGTELETLNHSGRHEFHNYFNRAFNNDPNLEEFICGGGNCGRLFNMLQIREEPQDPGTYLAVDAPEFYTHAAGRILSLHAPPGVAADSFVVDWVTHGDTGGFDDTPGPCHSGLYRNPLPLSAADSLIAVHAGERSPGVPETRQAANEGTRALPVARYKFRMRDLVATSGGCSGYLRYGAPLTSGITKTLWFWDPDVRVEYANVTMWELDPVEVRPRSPVDPPPPPLEAPELSVFVDEQVDPAAFRADLAAKKLALVVSRDVTTRDLADRQQPFNLRVPGGTAQTTGAAGTIYDVAHLQFFQGDLIRGTDGPVTPSPGRRILAQRMHDARALNPPLAPGAPAASVEIGDDGSMAAFVPAHRAMTWQLTDGAGTSVVRERYWLTFQPGEIRLCTSCHGLNSEDQAGQPPPANAPEALRTLLRWWKNVIFTAHFEDGDTGEWSSSNP
ncbi:MAG: hypothetical protein AB7G12_14720 [Thermoanaerobaculia bacterium]